MIVAGHKTNNKFDPIKVLEVGAFLTSHPGWAVELRVTRPKYPANEYYIPELLEIVDGWLMWTPTDADTVEDGMGVAQVWAREPETGARGALCDEFDVRFKRGRTGVPVEIPAPMMPYLEAVLDKAAEIRVTADDVKADREAADQSASEAQSALRDLEQKIASGDFKGERGDPGKDGQPGPKGDPLTWDDLTAEQKASLKGEKGDRGADGQSITGPQGPKGDPLTWADLTPAQKASLVGPKGDKGDPGQSIVGPQGEPGPEGPQGPAGESIVGPAGPDGYSPSAKVERTATGAKITITDKSGTTEAVVNDGQGGGGAVSDVQVGGVSVLSGGVANVPIASVNTFGVFKPSATYGTQVNAAGNIASVTRTAEQYESASNALLVGKGTLDNVLGPLKSQISQLQTALIGVDEAADALMEVVGVE